MTTPKEQRRRVACVGASIKSFSLILGLLCFLACEPQQPTTQEKADTQKENVSGSSVSVAEDLRKDFARLVYDGEAVKTGEGFDYVVALYDTVRQKCGGSLISNKWVLTAAHCTGVVKVVANRAVLTSSGGIELGVCGFWQHEKYDKATYAHDIALIRVDTSGKKLETVRLPSSGAWESANPEPDLTILGWGSSCKAGAFHLCKSSVDLVPRSTCAAEHASHGLPWSISSLNLCTTIGHTNTTLGDSGGPLIADLKEPTLVGVISSGFQKDVPDRHMRVSGYLPWIEKVQADHMNAHCGS